MTRFIIQWITYRASPCIRKNGDATKKKVTIQPFTDNMKGKILEKMYAFSEENGEEAKSVTDFINAFLQIQTTSKELSVNASKVSNATIESDSEQIKKDTIECITGSLTSLAHQIDFGQSSFNECKKDLEVSKSDCNNSNHFRGVPSPFIKRYASRITKHAEELSQKLASYNSRFQPNQQLSGFKEQDESQVLIDLLVEQQKSILRISSRVADINERLEKIRSIMKTRLKTNISASQVEDIQQVPCAQKVQDEYKRFLSDKKQKRIKIAEETDLFGNSTKVIPKKTNSFQFGGGDCAAAGTGRGEGSQS